MTANDWLAMTDEDRKLRFERGPYCHVRDPISGLLVERRVVELFGESPLNNDLGVYTMWLVRKLRDYALKIGDVSELERLTDVLSQIDKKTEEERNKKRTISAVRRARKCNAKHESIDLLKVLKRDSYRCHICKSRTLKRLRGKHEPLSPEVDHIIPLAAGGSHTWDNVACICRRCNRRKGAKTQGQLRLPE